MSLTAARLRELFHYDPETGVMTRRVTISSRAKIGDIAGCPNASGYLRLMIDGTFHLVHRLAWLYMTGQWPEGVIDHKDTAPGNNRWANLRDVSSAINNQNQRTAHADSQTGLLGVTRNKNGFRARICVDRETKRLGTFATPEAAHQAYVAAKRQLHQGGTL